MLLTYWTMQANIEMPPEALQIPDGVSIRWMGEARDAETVAQLYGEAFQTDPWGDDWMRFEGFDPTGVVIAESSGKPVGFAISYTRKDGAYISVVATVPQYRRRGIARVMIWQVLSRFSDLGCRQVKIDVREENVPAIRCYESVGFLKIAEFKADEACRIPRETDETQG